MDCYRALRSGKGLYTLFCQIYLLRSKDFHTPPWKVFCLVTPSPQEIPVQLHTGTFLLHVGF